MVDANLMLVRQTSWLKGKWRARRLRRIAEDSVDSEGKRNTAQMIVGCKGLTVCLVV
jgi:hypothetical protein